MKKYFLVIFLTLIVFLCGCSVQHIGYVDARYEAGIMLNEGGTTTYYKIYHFGLDVKTGNLVVVNTRKKSVKNYIAK